MNKIESHIAFKINTSYKLELLSKKKVNNAEKIGINPEKTASKTVVQKTAETTRDLIGNYFRK